MMIANYFSCKAIQNGYKTRLCAPNEDFGQLNKALRKLLYDPQTKILDG